MDGEVSRVCFSIRNSPLAVCKAAKGMRNSCSWGMKTILAVGSFGSKSAIGAMSL